MFAVIEYMSDSNNIRETHRDITTKYTVYSIQETQRYTHTLITKYIIDIRKYALSTDHKTK